MASSKRLYSTILCWLTLLALVTHCVKFDSVAIVGGGPIGLTAAIFLKKAGVRKVTVFEKRSDYTRLVYLNIREPTVSKWCSASERLCHAFKQKASVLENTQVIVNDILESDYSKRQITTAPSTSVLSHPNTDPEEMMKQRPTYQIVISDLEKILRQEAETLKLVFSQKEIQGPNDPNLRGFQLVVAADGSNSVIRKGHGIQQLIASDPQYFVAGSIKTEPQARLERYIRVAEDRQLVHSVVVGHGKVPQTWVVTQIPVSLEKEAQTWSEKEVNSWYINDAKKLLNSLEEDTQNLLSGVLSWFGSQNTRIHEKKGSPSTRIFKVQSWYAERVIQDRFVLIGDAARQGHFMTSGGVNVGVLADVNALEYFIETKDQEAMDHKSWSGTHAWLGSSRYLLDLYESAPDNHIKSRKVTSTPTGVRTSLQARYLNEVELFEQAWVPLCSWVGRKGYSDFWKGRVSEMRMFYDKKFALELMKSRECWEHSPIVLTGFLTQAETDYLRQGCLNVDGVPVADWVENRNKAYVPDGKYPNPYSAQTQSGHSESSTQEKKKKPFYKKLIKVFGKQ